MVKLTAFDVPPPGAGLDTVTAAVPAVAMAAAGIAAVNCVALTPVMVGVTPAKFTTELATKLVPFTVRVKAPPVTTALVGEIVVIVGVGLVAVMVNVKGSEVPPPGEGLVAVTAAVPAVAMAAAGIAAVNCVALTNVVVRATSAKFTTELATKFVPFTVRVTAAPPAAALVGEIVVIVGVGLVAVMVNVKGSEVPPPGEGLVAVTAAVPAVAMAAAGIAAVNCVALTNVVVRATPAKFTTELATKFVPFTVRVKAAPVATALVGEVVVIVGVGLDPLGEAVEAADPQP
jgi:hypothetical protein